MFSFVENLTQKKQDFYHRFCQTCNSQCDELEALARIEDHMVNETVIKIQKTFGNESIYPLLTKEIRSKKGLEELMLRDLLHQPPEEVYQFVNDWENFVIKFMKKMALETCLKDDICLITLEETIQREINHIENDLNVIENGEMNGEMWLKKLNGQRKFPKVNFN